MHSYESPRFITPVKNGRCRSGLRNVLNVEPENRVARRRIQEAIDLPIRDQEGRSIVYKHERSNR